MKEVILQYAPMVLFFIMVCIDRFGFTGLFKGFQSKIEERLNVAKIEASNERLRKEIENIKGQYQVIHEEYAEIMADLQELVEKTTHVKRSK